jgi:hypothetical protein
LGIGLSAGTAGDGDGGTGASISPTARHLASKKARIFSGCTERPLALAASALKANAAIRMPSTGALVSHAPIADFLRFQPHVAAGITDVTYRIIVPT